MSEQLKTTVLGILALVLFPLVVGANKVTDPSYQNSEISDSNTESAGVMAKRWGLSVEEWDKYLDIKKGPHGFWSPGLDPIAMLALGAESDSETRYYATLYAHMQDARIQRELLVDRYRREAVQELYRGKSTFDAELLDSQGHDGYRGGGTHSQFLGALNSQFSNPADQFMLGDRLIYFVDIKITPRGFLQRLTDKISKNSGVNLDIYVKNASSDEEIAQWAAGVGINASYVKQKRITLNHERGALAKFSTDNAESQLFLKRADNIFRVKETSF